MKKSILRAVSALLCCGLLAGCAAQKNQPQSHEAQNAGETQEKQAGITLAYSKEQGFNPYLTASNLTAQCSDLLYSRLVEITDTFEVEYAVASRVVSSGNLVEITVGSASFADGSAVTAADVAASVEAARASALYGGRFGAVQSVTASGAIVTITLSEPDSLFVYLLDIPVLKAQDTTNAAPLSSGRYSVGEANGAPALLANESFAGSTPFDVIYLSDMSAYDAILAGLGSGAISLYATEQDSELGGSSSCNTVCYNLNNLIFLGMNGEKGALANAAVRKAVSAGVSRRQIADRVYYSRAYVATNLANSRYPFVGEHTMKADADSAAAKALLEGAGYVMDESTGFYKDAVGKQLTLELLCSSGSTFKRYAATLVAAQLAECGINVTLAEESDFAAYKEKVVTGQYTLYIGEVKLYNNINMSPFFADRTAMRGGLAITDELTAAYAAARADSAAWGAFEQAFAAQMPFVPLVYKNGVVSAARSLSGLAPTISDIFYGFEQVTQSAAS